MVSRLGRVSVVTLSINIVLLLAAGFLPFTIIVSRYYSGARDCRCLARPHLHCIADRCTSRHGCGGTVPDNGRVVRADQHGHGVLCHPRVQARPGALSRGPVRGLLLMLSRQITALELRHIRCSALLSLALMVLGCAVIIGARVASDAGGIITTSVWPFIPLLGTRLSAAYFNRYHPDAAAQTRQHNGIVRGWRFHHWLIPRQRAEAFCDGVFAIAGARTRRWHGAGTSAADFRALGVAQPRSLCLRFGRASFSNNPR